jgi:hypothetical protein
MRLLKVMERVSEVVFMTKFRVLKGFTLQDRGNKLMFFEGNVHDTADFQDEQITHWLGMNWIEICSR